MNLFNYFDLQQLISEVIGSTVLAIIIGNIAIIYFATKRKISNKVIIMLCIIFTAIMSSRIYSLWIIVVGFVLVFFYYYLSKWISRGG